MNVAIENYTCKRELRIGVFVIHKSKENKSARRNEREHEEVGINNRNKKMEIIQITSVREYL